jgi:ribose-phosphate pyrophosphokinase
MPITFSTRKGPGFLAAPTFESMVFPAGEPHIKVVNENVGQGRLTEIAYVTGCDAEDLILLGMWADAANQRGSKTVALMPYLPGARQDRGLPFGAHVYADIINGFQLDQIVCFDPHSPVMPGLLDNLTIVDSAALIRHHIVGRPDSDEHGQKFTGIIAPDKGAVERAGHVARVCGLPLYRAEKKRDETTGNLTGFTCEELPAGGRYLIVDDICDGGGTFRGLAEATGNPASELALFVSHGVFSGKAIGLTESFGEVFTTDSYPPINDIGATVIPLARELFAAIKYPYTVTNVTNTIGAQK